MAHFYFGVAEDVNFLMSQGHGSARRYPLSMLWREARTARRRIVNTIETEAVIQQAVVASAFAKKGTNPLKAAFKNLRERDGGA